MSSPVKATCQMWSLAQLHGRTSDSKGAVGRAVVHGEGGQTTAIASVNPAERTITTINGSVYALGVPKLMFVAKHPEIMRELGF